MTHPTRVFYKRLPRRLTVKWIRAHVCDETQADLFAKVFPRGCTINRHNLVKAAESRLNIWWLCRYVKQPNRGWALKARRAGGWLDIERHRHFEVWSRQALHVSTIRRIGAHLLADALGVR